MRTAILISIMLLIATSNLMAADISGNYQDVISKIESQDGKRELASCVHKWVPKTKEMALRNAYRKGFSTDKDGLILESGNAGWGGYSFAYIWKSQGKINIWTNIGVKEASGKLYRGNLIAFSEVLEIIASSSNTLHGLARDADDSPCYFIRAYSEEKIVEFAVVAPRSAGVLSGEETVINKVLQLIRHETRVQVLH